MGTQNCDIAHAVVPRAGRYLSKARLPARAMLINISSLINRVGTTYRGIGPAASIAGLIMCILCVSTFADDVDLLAQARVLLDRKQAAQAYALLEPNIAARAGERDFDYLLGVAALDSGKPDLAVFALERLIASAPDFGGARVELGRAYYALGELRLAQQEFEAVMDLGPPAPLKSSINDFLATIKRRLAQQRREFHAYVEIGLGADTNANSAADLDQYLGVTLSDTSRRLSSSVLHEALGANGAHRLTRSISLMAGAEAIHRTYTEAPFLDHATANVYAGLNRVAGRARSSIYVSASRSDVDDAYNNHGTHIIAQHSHQFGGVTGGVFTRLGGQRYAQAYRIKDVDQVVAGVQVNRTSGEAATDGSVLFAGKDYERQETSPYGRDYVGLRISRSAVGDKTRLYGSLGLLGAHYEKPFFSIRRIDKQLDLQLGAELFVTKTWSVQPRFSFVRNRSDVELYDYARSNASLLLKYQWL